MRSVAFIAALAGLAAAAPQAVTSAIAPAGESTPAGCQTSYDGKFQLQVLSIDSKKSLHKRQSVALEITLKDGVLTDAQGRTGYIASNNQFQFDGPVQAGAIYTAGWSVCANSSLALGNSAIFYQCLSGSFYNLYDEAEAQQCSPVYLNALGATPTTAAASAATDGQVTAAKAATVICQIGDGQVQQNTCITTQTPVAPITQISDGQIQAPTATPTASPVTQISDGQIQAPVSSASSAAAPITQISDGQVQAPTSTPTASPVAQASDGQIQAPGNATSPVRAAATPSSSASASPSAFTGAAAAPVFRAELLGLAVGVVALVAAL